MKWEQISSFKKRVLASATFFFIAFFAYGLVYPNHPVPPIVENTETKKSEPANLPSTGSLQKESSEKKEEPSPQLEPQPPSASPPAPPTPSANRNIKPPQTKTIQHVSQENQVRNIAADESPSIEPPKVITALAQSEPSTDLWLWFGSGVNFTSYSQSMSEFSDVSFGKINTPSQVFQGGFFFDDNLALSMTYRNTPGKIEGGLTTVVENGSYEWKTMIAEVLYRSVKSNREEKNAEWIWSLGIQHHQMPFIVPLTANTLSIQSNSTAKLSLGTKYQKLTTKKIRIETYLGFQHPVSSSAEVGTSFKLSPKYTFDGSIGAAYEFKPHIYLGLYWYGQYFNNEFSYTNNGSLFSGSQKLFFTNFDVRLGVEF